RAPAARRQVDQRDRRGDAPLLRRRGDHLAIGNVSLRALEPAPVQPHAVPVPGVQPLRRRRKVRARRGGQERDAPAPAQEALTRPRRLNRAAENHRRRQPLRQLEYHERRARDGLTPKRARKRLVRWPWLANPTSWATAAIERSPSSSAARAWRRRSSSSQRWM